MYVYGHLYPYAFRVFSNNDVKPRALGSSIIGRLACWGDPLIEKQIQSDKIYLKKSNAFVYIRSLRTFLIDELERISPCNMFTPSSNKLKRALRAEGWRDNKLSFEISRGNDRRSSIKNISTFKSKIQSLVKHDNEKMRNLTKKKLNGERPGIISYNTIP